MEFKALTGLRGVAALWVLLTHFHMKTALIIPQEQIFHPIIRLGNVAVDVFFVLSGFIITFVYHKIKSWGKKDIKTYVLKRVARIYPIHLVTLLIIVAMVVVANLLEIKVDGNYSETVGIYHLLCLHSLPFVEYGHWNYPSWSISAEFLGYLLIFPITVKVFKNSFIRKFSLLICVLLITSYSLMNYHGIYGDWQRIFRITFEFFAGSALFYAVKDNGHYSVYFKYTLPVIIVLGIISCYLFKEPVTRAILIGLTPLLVAGVATDEGVICKFLSYSPVKYLGVISYSLYMTHAIVEKIFKVIFPVTSVSNLDFMARLFIYLAHYIVPIIVAAIFYHIIEKPSRNYILKKWV